MTALASTSLQAQGATSTAASKGRVLAAIQSASAKTGVSFGYLVQKAQQESGLNSTAKAANSSATGLYQFVDQTWLRMVKAHGADYGLDREAGAITIGTDGVARVSDAQTKKQILALRNNPEISAEMAAEYAQDNKESLQKQVGGSIGNTELYLAHFLGANGASQFLNAMKTNPKASGADLLPSAAAANKSVFYNKDGTAKSVQQIYAAFDKKFDGASDATTMMAALGDGTTTAASGAQIWSDKMQMKPSSATSNQVADASQSIATGILGGTAAATSAMAARIAHSTSTPFAAMILAQIDLAPTQSDTASSGQNDPDNKRKNTLLGLIG